MARKKRHLMEKADEPGLDISSLIDVSFLLLIYFLVTSTIQKRERDLGMVMPSDSEPTENVESRPLLVKVTKSGEILLHPNEETPEVISSDVSERELPKLYETVVRQKKLAESVSNSGGLIVIVIAEDDSKSQRFMDVLNCLRKAKVTQITLTGFKENETG